MAMIAEAWHVPLARDDGGARRDPWTAGIGSLDLPKR
jgi:hypothetical protein